ncbi:MAG: sulfatase-like hydrolase/transferase, partial [Candidatus Hydrogenedentes bacterium]|nr:sulfatase-like hydrolase/transferase [Candidatus Hydrogenedentota bacterium]
YRPDLEADYAIEFIKQNANRPFVCWLSFYPPHTPKTVPDENLALYAGKFDNKEQDIYYAMVNRIDQNIGRVIDTVKKLGLREKTLVVFTSDHGENYPFRWNQHRKRLCYDQAANVPLIISWPGVLPKGKRIDKVVSIVDLAPTILDLCGMPIPETLHGQSAKRLLDGDDTGWHEDIFIQNTPYPPKAKGKPGADIDMRERCVVTDRWKLILNTTRPPELYDRTSPTPDKENLLGRAESKKVVPDLVRRLAVWGRKADDKITDRLIAQWKLG